VTGPGRRAIAPAGRRADNRGTQEDRVVLSRIGCLLAVGLFVACAARADAGVSDACDGTTKGANAPPIVRPALFAYDAKADLGVQVTGTKTTAGVVVQDVTFLARVDRPGDRTAAYIVAPANPAASMAAILWVHWLGEPATTNRTQFLDEATALAGRGVVSVLVDTMWAKPRWYRDRVLEADQQNYIGQAVALRRALDLLLAQPGADASRVAVVGHDYGAMHAALVAGVDPRPRAYVLIAATASMLDWAFFYGKQPVSREAYLAQHEAISLCDHLATAKGSAFLFQFAEQDQYVPLARAQALFAATAGRKAMTVYGGAGHEMTAPPAIRLDRTAWLLRELAIDAPPR
jgi:dienelactone hydrolase